MGNGDAGGWYRRHRIWVGPRALGDADLNTLLNSRERVHLSRSHSSRYSAPLLARLITVKGTRPTDAFQQWKVSQHKELE